MAHRGYRNAMVDFQRDLTAVNAVGPTNGGDGEWQRAGFVREALNAMGMGRVRELHAVDSRAYAGRGPISCSSTRACAMRLLCG